MYLESTAMATYIFDLDFLCSVDLSIFSFSLSIRFAHWKNNAFYLPQTQTIIRCIYFLISSTISMSLEAAVSI